MFQGWRFQLREAEEAFDQGRLDDAAEMLAGDLQQYLPGKRLATKVSSRMADRARQRVIRGEVSAGWRDLENARQLGGDSEAVLQVRDELVELALSEVEGHLREGEAGRASALLEVLEKRDVQGEQLEALKEMARRFESADNLTRRGRFAEADKQLRAAATLRPLPVIETRREQLRQQLQDSRQLQSQLHQAMAAQQWTEVLLLADQLLELAPEHRLGRDAHARAWQEVGAKVSRGSSRRTDVTQYWARGTQSQAGAALCEEAPRDPNRFLLWVDAVGGYLVCLADEVAIGQAAPGNGVDVPILGDLSRRHAKVRRMGDGYVIEPLQPLQVAGRTVDERTLLTDGDEVEMGTGVRMRFRQPHALSASARLEFVSRHRTQPSADGVLLMAESCVLGPQWQNHVVCRDWSGDVVLYRQEGELYCRSMDAIEIDGRRCEGRGRVRHSSRVAGEDFALSLEPI